MGKDRPCGKLKIKGRDKSHRPEVIQKEPVTALNLTLRRHPAEPYKAFRATSSSTFRLRL